MDLDGLNRNLRNVHGERLDATFQAGTTDGHGSDARRIVVLGHGVTGNKDRPALCAVADGLAAAGIASLRVSFSGNGESEGRFEESCISKEVEDLGAVLDALQAEGVERVGYVGHSMGAAVGVLRAARDPRIVRLVSLAGMVHTRDFADRKFGAQTPDQSLMWDKPECPLSSEFMADLRELNSVLDAGKSLIVPWLLVHGTADTVVPPSDSTDIVAVASSAELIQLEGVDHVFTESGLKQMAVPVVQWFADAKWS